MNGYNVVKKIGKGGFGEVWLVKSEKLSDKKKYVLKKIALTNASKREHKYAQLEVKLLASMQHPNIVSYKDSHISESIVYIVMGFCEGGDLYNFLINRKGDPIEENIVLEWFIQISMALQYIHTRNILHRDLKTQNIFLTRNKIIKLGDFGIARVLDTSSDLATTRIGTPYNMSPEIFSNTPYDYKSDIWSLGCCLYEMTSLRMAFNARDMDSLICQILRGKLPPMPKNYSENLQNLMKRMLSHNPKLRPSVDNILNENFIKKNIEIFLRNSEQKVEKNIPMHAKIRNRINNLIPNKYENGSSSVKNDNQMPLVNGRLGIGVEPKEANPVQKSIDNPSLKKKNILIHAKIRNRINNLIPNKYENGSSSVKNDNQMPLINGRLGIGVEPKEANPVQKSIDNPSLNAAKISDVKTKVSRPLPPPRKVNEKSKADEVKLEKRKSRPLPPAPKLEGKIKVEKIKLNNGVKNSKEFQSADEKTVKANSQENIPAKQYQCNVSARQRRREKMVQNNEESNKQRPNSAPVLRSNENSSENSQERKVDENSEFVELISALNETLECTEQTPSAEDELELGNQSNVTESIESRRKELQEICVSGLGQIVCDKAVQILYSYEDEESQHAELLSFLGKNLFDNFAGRLWQMKFCNDVLNL